MVPRQPWYQSREVGQETSVTQQVTTTKLGELSPVAVKKRSMSTNLHSHWSGLFLGHEWLSIAKHPHAQPGNLLEDLNGCKDFEKIICFSITTSRPRKGNLLRLHGW